jgi:hypothetical protein
MTDVIGHRLRPCTGCKKPIYTAIDKPDRLCAPCRDKRYPKPKRPKRGNWGPP